MRARRFEELYFWQKARELAKTMCRVTSGSSFDKELWLREQLRSLGTTVMGEIAFGFAQATGAEFKDSLDIARGELMRLRAMCYLSQDLDCLAEEDFEEIQAGIMDVDRLMMGFIRGMRGGRHREHDEHEEGESLLIEHGEHDDDYEHELTDEKDAHTEHRTAIRHEY